MPLPPLARPYLPPLRPPQSRTAAPNRGTALTALDDLAALEAAAGRPLAASTYVVGRALCRMAFEPNGRRAGRGLVETFYSEVASAAGLARTAVGAAMRTLRRLGFIEGEPCPPDPANDWLRERATYRVMIPPACKQVLARLAHAARSKARDLFSQVATRVAGPDDVVVVTSREIDKPRETPRNGPVDNPWRGATPAGFAIIDRIRAQTGWHR